MSRKWICVGVPLVVVFVLAFEVNYQYTVIIGSQIKVMAPTLSHSTYSVNATADLENEVRSRTHNISISNTRSILALENDVTILENTSTSNASLDINADYDFTDIVDYTPRTQYRLTWDQELFSNEVRQCSNDSKFVFLPARRGRMGNNMFQVASLIGTAYDLDLIPIIKPTFALRVYFDLPNMLAFDVENARACTEPGYGVYARCRNQQGVIGRNVSLIGFRQSWKYFNSVTEDVRNVFRFKETFMNAAKDFIETVAKPDYKIVGIHVRRGDITPAKRRSRGNAVAEEGFFTNSIEYFKRKYKNVTFIIMSNDMRWCKENLYGDDIVYSSFKNAGNDMALMTLCDNMILTYGSFGYWGAWLSGKPAVYFWEEPRARSKGARARRRSDYYPPEWLPMPN